MRIDETYFKGVDTDDSNIEAPVESAPVALYRYGMEIYVNGRVDNPKTEQLNRLAEYLENFSFITNAVAIAYPKAESSLISSEVSVFFNGTMTVTNLVKILKYIRIAWFPRDVYSVGIRFFIQEENESPWERDPEYTLVLSDEALSFIAERNSEQKKFNLNNNHKVRTLFTGLVETGMKFGQSYQSSVDAAYKVCPSIETVNTTTSREMLMFRGSVGSKSNLKFTDGLDDEFRTFSINEDKALTGAMDGIITEITCDLKREIEDSDKSERRTMVTLLSLNKPFEFTFHGKNIKLSDYADFNKIRMTQCGVSKNSEQRNAVSIWGYVGIVPNKDESDFAYISSVVFRIGYVRRYTREDFVKRLELFCEIFLGKTLDKCPKLKKAALS